MSSEEVNVIALVENLELAVPRRLPVRRQVQQESRTTESTTTRLQLPQTTRVIELADRDSKMAFKRRFNLDFDLEDGLVGNSTRASESEDRESLEILRQLPPGTILIKQVDAKDSSHDEESEDKSVTEGIKNDRPKRPLQRNRNRKTLEVRRNPLRSASTRKDGPSFRGTSRQRLLAAKRRAVSCAAADPSFRRPRSATAASLAIGYMSTRSVTRKMGSNGDGANYEAPTWRDQVEWKQWPAHGMHERPVYHPQFGLAAEYNGRLFASFDGESYREITAETQIEIVRVDPRVESLDRQEDLRTSTPPISTSTSQDVTRYVRQQSTAAAVVRQKLATAQTTTTPSRTDKPKLTNLPTFGGRNYERLHMLTQSLGLTHQRQQHQQIRSLERLQQLENLQRLSSKMRLQSGEGCSKYPTTTSATTPTGRLLSKEVVFRTLQNATLNPTGQRQNLPKCLLLPRRSAPVPPASPVALPFCEVQAVKGNPKGKLFFVRTSDASKKLVSEKPATSSTTSTPSTSGVSWAEMTLCKRLDGSSALVVDVPRTYAGQARESRLVPQQQQQRRGYPPIRLAESTGMFRPKVATPRDDPGLSTNKRSDVAGNFENKKLGDDQQAEVLDLSKKETRLRLGEDADAAASGSKVTRACATDLVRYFQNFGADENTDCEDPKNLT